MKSVSAVAAKWAKVTPQRTEEYSAGISAPRKSWSAAASAANESYKAGVTAAANANRFASGVTKAGDQKWQQMSLEKGPSRFAQGVQVAQPAYESGFARYAQVITSTTLPPRYPRGDPRNIQRVTSMAKALSDARMSK
jgi:hypothetical protein